MAYRIASHLTTSRKQGEAEPGRFVPSLLAAYTTLVALGANGTDFGLPGFVTTNRIAYMLLMVGVGLLLGRGYNQRLSVARTVMYLSLPLGVVGVWSLLSWAAWQGSEAVSVGYGVAWLIQAIAAVALGIVARAALRSGTTQVINGLILGSLVATTVGLVQIWDITPVDALRSGNWWAMRQAINSGLSAGLNRQLNGLLVLSIIPTAVILGVIRRRGALLMISWFVVTVFLVMALGTGSRQNLLGGLFILLAVWVVNSLIWRKQRRYRPDSHRQNRVWPRVVTIFAAGLFLLWTMPEISDWAYHRVIRTTETQLAQSDGDRLGLYVTAIHAALSHPVLGVGPGAFHNQYGKYPHNGYLGLAAQSGLLPTVFLIGVVFSTLWRSYRTALALPMSDDRRGFVVALLAGAIVLFVWNANLNDLIDDAMYWAVMVLLVTVMDRETSSQQRSPSNDPGCPHTKG